VRFIERVANFFAVAVSAMGRDSHALNTALPVVPSRGALREVRAVGRLHRLSLLTVALDDHPGQNCRSNA
jgi:hypothetical protein